MRISGFTIARNARRFDYPLVESIRSLLPLVDEYVVGVGDCDDGTWELVQSIGDVKIQAFRSTWDLSHRDGLTLAEETNKAFERCTGDWAIYLQADEVLHEGELPRLRAALGDHLQRRTEGLSFRYHHFFGAYDVVQDNPRRYYRRATRAVKTGIGIRSVGDGCGFRVRTDSGWRAVRRRNVDVHVFHYGHVRPPAVMTDKRVAFLRLYTDAPSVAPRDPSSPRDVYDEIGHLERFAGTHPGVMKARIAAQDWTFDPGIERQPPRWLRHAGIVLTWPPLNVLRRAWRRFT